MVYPNTIITIEYKCSVNDAKPKLASPNNSDINISYYSYKQALTSSTNLQYFICTLPLKTLKWIMKYICKTSRSFENIFNGHYYVVHLISHCSANCTIKTIEKANRGDLRRFGRKKAIKSEAAVLLPKSALKRSQGATKTTLKTN